MDIQEIRRGNMRALAEQWGGVNRLAEKLGYTNGSFLVQMTGPHPIREVSERTARRVEKKLDLPEGWLDRDHAGKGEVPADIDIVAVMREVSRALADAKISLSNEKFSEVVVLVLTHTRATGALDSSYIRALVKLLK